MRKEGDKTWPQSTVVVVVSKENARKNNKNVFCTLQISLTLTLALATAHTHTHIQNTTSFSSIEPSIFSGAKFEPTGCLLCIFFKHVVHFMFSSICLSVCASFVLG